MTYTATYDFGSEDGDYQQRQQFDAGSAQAAMVAATTWAQQNLAGCGNVDIRLSTADGPCTGPWATAQRWMSSAGFAAPEWFREGEYEAGGGIILREEDGE